jgi:hypothetical protein
LEHSASAANTAALRIGPSPRLDRAAGLLEALARALPAAPQQSRWFDAVELLLFGARDLVVLDADHFSLEDIGIVRRFLVARPEARVEVLGSDRAAPAAAELLGLPGTHWQAWPPDLARLEEFLRIPAAHEPPQPAAPQAGAEREAEPTPSAARGPLADLMAQVRRTIDAHLTLRGSGNVESGPSEQLAAELLRLERCVRGLLLSAEGAPQAATELDLDALVEEELAVLALQSRRAPRVRYQGGEVLPVRSDRAVLVHILGVLLELARTLTGAGELVEVRSLKIGEAIDSAVMLDPLAGAQPAGPRALIRLRAPAGVLAALLPTQLFQAGGLGERLPGFGPGDLHTLARLCAQRGLGLRARLLAGSPAQVEFDLDLPIVERSATILAGSRGH